eukprot:jgi/Bigna1/140346/aug1.55_g15054
MRWVLAVCLLLGRFPTAATFESEDEGFCVAGGHCELNELLASYKERHLAVTESLKANKEPPGHGFIVMQPSGGGLGNRELVSISGLALALTTDRVALVDWYGVTSNDISDVHQVYDSPHGLTLSYPKLRSLWPSWSGWKSEKMYIFDSTNVYNQMWGADEMVCTDLKSELKNVKVLRVITEQYVTSLVTHNPKVRHIFEPLMPNLYQHLSSFFVRPLSVIADRVEEFYLSHMKENYVIGIQVRRAQNSGHFFLWEDQHLFWECALMMASRASRRQQRPVVFFIATDSESVRSEAVQALGKVYQVLTVEMDTRKPDTRGDEGWQNALVDNYVLSRCDDMLVSGGSTFGYVAHGRSDVIPMVVSGFHRRCMRPPTAEPYNIGYLAIKKVSCFDPKAMLTQETDMICSSVQSVHSCASHSAELMADIMGPTKKPHFDLGEEQNLPKSYLKYAKSTAVAKKKMRKWQQSDVVGMIEEAHVHTINNRFAKAKDIYARAAVAAASKGDSAAAGDAFYALAGCLLLSTSRAKETGEDTNVLFSEAMKALYSGLRLSPYRVEANIIMGNFMEIWGGTPRSHVGVQFYRRAQWCLEAETFEYDVEEDNLGSNHHVHTKWVGGCALMGIPLEEAAEMVSLDMILLTSYVHLARSLGKAGRQNEAREMSKVMEDDLPPEVFELREKVDTLLSPELVRMLLGADFLARQQG